jgi:hypothetical protein
MTDFLSLQKISKYPSLIYLIVANLFPLAGVFFWNWSVSDFMWLYWAESVTVWFYAVLKLVKSANYSGATDFPMIVNNKPSKVGLTGLILFFAIHFGMFMLGHAVFLAAMFGLPKSPLPEFLSLLSAIFLSHGISFYLNFIQGREFEGAKPEEQMLQPYFRLALMHVTLIFAGFFLQGQLVLNGNSIDASVIPMSLLVLLKTAVDAYSHLTERKKCSQVVY